MKILVLTDKYYPRPFANAICAQELIRVWKSQGHIVDVLAYQDFDGNPDEWEENEIYHVKPDCRLRLFYYANTYPVSNKGKWAKTVANVVSKIKGVFLLPWQPFWSFAFPNRIYKAMVDLQDKNNYDAVIAILKPLDSNIAACKFKAAYPAIPYVVFCVDSMKKAIVEKYIGRGFADGFFWEKRILKKCDAFFYMKSRRDNYLQHRYDTFRSKLLETDLPRFKIKDITKIPKYDFGEDGEHWVYAGSIGGVHYNPSKMIEIFNKIADSPKRILHLFTRGNEAEKIKMMAESYHWNIRVHGYVDIKQHA